LKDKFSSTLVLKFPNFTKLFEVHTDVNDFVIGGVLMQEGHPIAFENKNFVGHNYNGQLMKKELYALLCCLKMWQTLLGDT
jgi:hypothetical protein